MRCGHIDTKLRQARAALRQVRPAAIILDILLRGEDSWQWLSEIKANEATRDIPVIVVTTVEDSAKGRALGADAYLVKPVARQQLIATLDNLVGREAPARADTGRPSRLEAITALIVDDLTGGYAAADHVVKGVSFGVAPGELVCVIGPNGAGKSTVLKLLTGLLRPRAGHVALDLASHARRGLVPV